MKHWSWIFPLVTVTISLLTIGIGSLVLAAPGTIVPAKITLNIRESSKSDVKVLSVSAQLSDTDRPLGGQTLDFFVTADFFGKRLVKIGQAVTDATGTAGITYQPRWEGTHLITARFQGDTRYGAVETTRTIQVTGPIGVYIPENVSLRPVGSLVLITFFLLLSAVWILVLFTVFRLVRGIPRYNIEKDTEDLLYESAFIPIRDSGTVNNLEKGVSYARTEIMDNRR